MTAPLKLDTLRAGKALNLRRRLNDMRRLVRLRNFDADTLYALGFGGASVLAFLEPGDWTLPKSERRMTWPKKNAESLLYLGLGPTPLFHPDQDDAPEDDHARVQAGIDEAQSESGFVDWTAEDLGQLFKLTAAERIQQKLWTLAAYDCTREEMEAN